MRATFGLEDVVADELAGVAGVGALQIRHRTVSGTTTGSAKDLLGLRAADDVFLELARFDGMERARAALAHLAGRAAEVDLHGAFEVLGVLRPLPEEPRLSVSASFVGRRNYTTAELKDTVGRAVAGRHGLPIATDDRNAALHLRLVLEHTDARIGLRLAREPLHERSWKAAHVPGSLKPTVAAALWRLVGLTPGLRALDPCCGAGTLLGEALALGARVAGGDVDPEALVAADANLRALGVRDRLVRWDAGALPLAADSIDVAAGNLPWGRQVTTQVPLLALYAGVARELARVLVPGGRAALLLGAPECFAAGPLRLDSQREIHLYGQRPSVLVLSRPRVAA